MSYDISENNPLMSSGYVSYSDVVNALGSQIVYKFLVIGIIFIIYSYWNRCGMRQDDFDGNWNSIPKIIMVAIFRDGAKEATKFMNGFFDGLASSVAFVSIAMWIAYKLGW